MTDKTHGDLIARLKGRSSFCRDRGEVKTPDLLDAAAAALADAADATTPVVGAEHAGDVRQAVPEWGTSDKAQHYAAMVTDTNDADILRAAISDLCRDNERLAVMLKSAKQPDPTPALGWRAMQTAAEAVSKEAHGETVLGGQRFKTVKLEDAVDAILAMTGPTHAQLLAEAVKLEAVRELVKAAKWIGVAAQTTGGTAGPDLDLIEAIDVLANALTQIGGAA